MSGVDLPAGEFDPAAGWCKSTHPRRSIVCTRAAGHEGPHGNVAHRWLDQGVSWMGGEEPPLMDGERFEGLASQVAQLTGRVDRLERTVQAMNDDGA